MNGTPVQPPASPTLTNPGSDFYATLYYPHGGKLVRAEGGDGSTRTNVQIYGGTYAPVNSTDPKDIWHFIRQSDGSYKIVNEWCGWCLDVYGGVAYGEANVGTWHEDHGDRPERWYIAEAPGSDGRWYSLISALEYPGYVMDVYGGYTSSGTNVQLWTTDWQTANLAQQFNIVQQSTYWRPSAPSAPARVWTFAPSDEVTVYWNAVPVRNSYDSRAYDVRLTNTDTGDVLTRTQQTGTNCTFQGLAPGNWVAEVRAVNTKYASYSSNYASSYRSQQFTVHTDCTITLTASPAEGGTVSGGGRYEYNDYVTIRAVPNDGYRFVQWRWSDGRVDARTDANIFVTEDMNITAVFELDDPYVDVPDEPDDPNGAVKIKNTRIKADSVFNTEGYGSLMIDGDYGVDDDGEYAIYTLGRLALVNREGTFLLPYRADPVGDGGYDTARFRYSDGVVSLTLGTPYISGGGIPQFYHLDGSKAFSLETTDKEYTDENGVKYHDWTSWISGPMTDGYAVAIEKLYSSWTGGGAGGFNSDGDNRTLIIDKNGTVTCELPEEYNQTTSGGGANLWYFSTQRSLGWCGEGLFAFYDHTIDYDDDWSSTTEVLGYMDPYGKTVIDLKGQGYINAWPFSESLAAVKDQSGKIGFIDRSGTLVIPCTYDDYSGDFTDGLCAVQKDGKWGYIDKTGNTVIPFEYDAAYGAGDGLASVGKDSKYGLVDCDNNVVVPLVYDDISSYDNGVAYAIKNDVLYIITDYDPDAPDTPDVPDVPDKPDIPDVPDVPDKPDVPTYPTYPIYPSYPGTSTRPNTQPSNPKPDKTEEPGQPVTPVEPETPSEPAEEPEVPAVNALPFSDVQASDWFHSAVRYVYANGLMTGETANTFSPAAPMTRAMVWTVLGRLSGADVNGGDPWYANAQSWAAAANISDGTDPDGSITREQLVTMLYRQAGNPVASADLSSFADNAAVSNWAAPAVRWAVANGLLVGDGGKLNPLAPASRAEVAALLTRFCENIAK